MALLMLRLLNKDAEENNSDEKSHAPLLSPTRKNDI